MTHTRHAQRRARTAAPPAPARGRGRGPSMHERIRARRRAVARARVRRRRRGLASVLAAVVLAAGAVGLTYTPLFAVDEVRVTGVQGQRALAVEQAAGIVVGERLLGVDLARVDADVTGLPWVRSVLVRRVPPSTVELAVEPRRPVAVVAGEGGRWLVDGDGVIVAPASADDLVPIEAPNSVLPGVGVEVRDAAVRNALAVHVGLPAPLRASVRRYDAASGNGLRLLLAAPGLSEEGVWVRFGLAERVPAKARVVDLLLAQAREHARRAGDDGVAGAVEIDVRAPDNPVLVPRPG